MLLRSRIINLLITAVTLALGSAALIAQNPQPPPPTLGAGGAGAGGLLMGESVNTNSIAKFGETCCVDTPFYEVGGNLGLGTNTPQARLHVYNEATADAFIGTGPNVAAGPAFNFGYGGGSFGRSAAFFNVRPDASASTPNPSIRFMTANVQHMIIAHNGNIGIGLADPNQTQPSACTWPAT